MFDDTNTAFLNAAHFGGKDAGIITDPVDVVVRLNTGKILTVLNWQTKSGYLQCPFCGLVIINAGNNEKAGIRVQWGHDGWARAYGIYPKCLFVFEFKKVTIDRKGTTA